MAEHPEPVSEIDAAPAKPEPNVPWEEPRGPLHALGWAATGCLGHGCGSSAIALAVIVVVTVVALLLV